VPVPYSIAKGYGKVMLNSFQNLSNKKLAELIRSLVFFIAFYLYLWLGVEMCLIYHGGGMITNFPAFFKGWAFFQQFITYPGGPVEYLSDLLSQFFYYSWAGALVVTLQAWLIFVCTDAFIKAVNSTRLRCIRFILPILLLVPYVQYTYTFGTVMGLLAALAFLCLYLKVVPKSKLRALVVFLILSVVLYYMAGGACLLFAGLCGIYELLFRRRWQVGLVCLLATVVIPYVGGVLVFDISIIDAFSNLTPIYWRIFESVPVKMRVILYMFFLLLPLAVLGLGLWLAFARRLGSSPNPKSKTQNSKLKILSWYTGSSALRCVVESCLLFVISGAAVLYFHDSKQKTRLEVDYYASRRMWSDVIVSAGGNPSDDFVAHQVNRALYHTGRMTDDMFKHFQKPLILFLPPEASSLEYLSTFDVYLDLGLMNMAENLLTESLAVFRERPRLLKRLAMISMVKGNIGAAGIYLGALSKTFFDAHWANGYIEKLKTDPTLKTNQEIQHLRTLMLKKDCGTATLINELLLDLLAENKQNRMAFEYLMSWYLLTKQLEKFVQNIDRLDDFDYQRIPRHYEEAILVYVASKQKEPDLRGRRFSMESIRRFKGFDQMLYRSGRNIDAARSELAKYYGDSYFFYCTYGFTGMEK